MMTEAWTAVDNQIQQFWWRIFWTPENWKCIELMQIRSRLTKKINLFEVV